MKLNDLEGHLIQLIKDTSEIKEHLKTLNGSVAKHEKNFIIICPKNKNKCDIRFKKIERFNNRVIGGLIMVNIAVTIVLNIFI